MKVSTVELGDEGDWDAFVARQPCGHFLQSTAWGRLRERWGWSVVRLAAQADGEMQAAAQVLIRRTRLGNVAYVPRGPVCVACAEVWPQLRGAIREAVAGAVVTRFEPPWPDEGATRRWLRGQGLWPAPPIQPPSTLLLDLSKSEDELLAQMKQKWRYNLRLAQRRGVRVELGGEEDLSAFAGLLAETAARDRFSVRPPEYYRDVWRFFGAAARLYLAERGGELLAGILVIHFGAVATYLYGASASHGREHMPNHLLQWEAMRAARRAGLAVYDLWGIPDAIGRAVVAGRAVEDIRPGRGGLWGVWRFKRGFGGRVWRSCGAWDDVHSPWRYWPGRFANWLLRRVGGGE